MTKRRATKLIMSLGYQRNTAIQLLMDEHNKGLTNLAAWDKIRRITYEMTDPAFWMKTFDGFASACRELGDAALKVAESVRKISTEVKLC